MVKLLLDIEAEMVLDIFEILGNADLGYWR